MEIRDQARDHKCNTPLIIAPKISPEFAKSAVMQAKISVDSLLDLAELVEHGRIRQLKPISDLMIHPIPSCRDPVVKAVIDTMKAIFPEPMVHPTQLSPRSRFEPINQILGKLGSGCEVIYKGKAILCRKISIHDTEKLGGTLVVNLRMGKDYQLLG